MSDRSPRATAGIAQAIVAAALFGISTPIAKGLLDGASPQVLAGLLYLVVGGAVLSWQGRLE